MTLVSIFSISSGVVDMLEIDISLC